MKKVLVSAIFLSSVASLAFSKNESEKKSSDGFVYQYNCNKQDEMKAKQDGVDPCEHLVMSSSDSSSVPESDKAL